MQKLHNKVIAYGSSIGFHQVLRLKEGNVKFVFLFPDMAKHNLSDQ